MTVDLSTPGVALPPDLTLPTEPEAPKRPWYRRPVLVLVGLAVVALVVVALTVFRSGGGGDQITTPDGTFTIEQVEAGTSIPEGCDPTEGLSCLAAESGYQIVKLTLSAGAPTGDTDIYLESTEGNRYEVAVVGFSEDESFIAFTPQESEHSFTLHWADDTVELDV